MDTLKPISTSSLAGLISVITTSVAPMALATIILSNPIGPAPQTRTVLPYLTSPRLQAYTATFKGSIKAPSSKLMLSGSL